MGPNSDTPCDTYGNIPGWDVGCSFSKRRDLYCIHDSTSTLAIGPEGPYSILLLRDHNLNDRGHTVGFSTGETQKFRGDNYAKPEGQFNVNLMISLKSQLPIRLIRASALKNCYAPAQGFRYDGLYCCNEYETDVIKGKLIFKFLLTRLEDQLPSPWETVNQSLLRSANDLMEITWEDQYHSSLHPIRDTLKFQVTINECFCIKEETYRDIPLNDLSIKEEILDPPVSTSQLIPFVADEEMIPGPSKIDTPFQSDNQYQVVLNIDSSDASELLSASGVISKDIVIPEDFFDSKDIIEVRNFHDDTTNCHDVKMHLDESDDNYSDPDNNGCYQFKTEIYDNHLIDGGQEESVEIPTLLSCNSSPFMKINDGISTEEVPSLSNVREVKTEVLIDDNQIIVPSPNPTYSPPHGDSIIKVNNSPDLSQISVIDEQYDTSRNNEQHVNHFERILYVNNCDSPLSLINECDVENSHENVVIKYCNSPTDIEQQPSSSLENEAEIQNAYLVESGRNVQLSNGMRGIPLDPLCQEASRRISESSLDDGKYILRESESGSVPNQSNGAWWYEHSSKKQVDLQSSNSDFTGKTNNKISLSDDTYPGCSCSPPPELIQPLLGNSTCHFALFFSDFWCKCKLLDGSSPSRTPEYFKRIADLLSGWDKNISKPITALLVYLLKQLYENRKTEEDPFSDLDPRTIPSSIRRIPKKKRHTKMILRDENDAKYNLIESDDGRYSLERQVDNFNPSLPDRFELENNPLKGRFEIFNDDIGLQSLELIKTPPSRPERVTRIASKRGRKIKVTKGLGHWKHFRRRNNKNQKTDDQPSLPVQSTLDISDPHFAGFLDFDVRWAEQYRDSILNEVISPLLHCPPLPQLSFRGFSNYDIMKCRTTERLFTEILQPPSLQTYPSPLRNRKNKRNHSFS